jgi:hypothetical protein
MPEEKHPLMPLTQYEHDKKKLTWTLDNESRATDIEILFSRLIYRCCVSNFNIFVRSTVLVPRRPDGLSRPDARACTSLHGGPVPPERKEGEGGSASGSEGPGRGVVGAAPRGHTETRQPKARRKMQYPIYFWNIQMQHLQTYLKNTWNRCKHTQHPVKTYATSW